MQGSVECHADDCGALAIAESEADALVMWNAGSWNYRIVDRDEDGIPIIEADAMMKAREQ
jgi:hypothetical protein